jgi:hypothetical protein
MVLNGFAAGNKASTPLTNAERTCYRKTGYTNDTDRLGGRLPVDECGWFYVSAQFLCCAHGRRRNDRSWREAWQANTGGALRATGGALRAQPSRVTTTVDARTR